MEENKGITLIVLVITIIIMLILAGVSIGLVFNGGLIDYARIAKTNTQEQIENEQLLANGIVNGKTINEWVNGENSGNSGESETGENEEKIILPAGWTVAQTLPTDWDENKVTAITDGTNTVPLPKGYIISGATTENNITNGLVIYEMTKEQEANVNWSGEDLTKTTTLEQAKKTYNQYVWVPVTNINNMVKLQTGSTTNYEGRLYNGTTELTNYGVKTVSYREPANLGTSYDNTTNIKEWTNTLYQEEFNEMVESVAKYKGFYVGRYETGGYNKDIAVILAGEITGSINNATWYKMYSKTKTLSTGYTKTHMIWGCQYDQMLKIAKCATKTTPNKEVSLIETGKVATDCYYNIYDLCGNVFEWTMEVNGTVGRVYRGGEYKDSRSASFRVNNLVYPSYSLIDFGSRAMLYIAP